MEKRAPYEGEKPYIFVSYAHRDQEAVERLIARLQGLGYRVWYDLGIKPGIRWQDDLAERIKGCGLFLALLSDGYVASDYCQMEITLANSCGVPMLPVFLEDTRLSSGLELILSIRQCVFRDRYGSQEEFVKALGQAEHMAGCLGRAPAEADRKIRLLYVLELTEGRMESLHILSQMLTRSVFQLFECYGQRVSVDLLWFMERTCWSNRKALLSKRPVDMGQALTALTTGYEIRKDTVPVVIFFSDRAEGPPCTVQLSGLAQKAWFRRAVRLGVSFGASQESLPALAGEQGGLVVLDPPDLTRLERSFETFQYLSMTAARHALEEESPTGRAIARETEQYQQTLSDS